MDSKRIRSHRELDVYQMAFKASIRIFEVSKEFPREEQYSLTDPRKLSGLRSERSDSHEVKNTQQKECATEFFEKVNIQKPSCPSYLMPKLKLQKLKHGLISVMNAGI